MLFLETRCVNVSVTLKMDGVWRGHILMTAGMSACNRGCLHHWGACLRHSSRVSKTYHTVSSR